MLHICSTLLNTSGFRKIGGFNSPQNLFQDVLDEAQTAAEMVHANVEVSKASFRNQETYI